MVPTIERACRDAGIRLDDLDAIAVTAGPGLAGALLVGAGVAAYQYVKTSDNSDTSDNSNNSGETPQGLAVQTEAFSFVLPETATVEPLANVVAGIQTTGTQWTVESGNFHLLVLAMNFGYVLDEATQQAAFDGAITGEATKASGSIVSDTWIVTDGVYQRDTIVAAPAGIIHVKSYGKGAWAVFIFGPSTGTDRPPGFTELITSFSFV